MFEELQEVFPRGWVSGVGDSDESLAMPLADGRFFHVPEDGLQASEKALINHFSGLLAGKVTTVNPWQAYLTKERTHLPSEQARIQFVHVAVEWTNPLTADKRGLQEVLTPIYPQLESSFWLDSNRLAMVLRAELLQASVIELQGLIPIVEEDFDCRLTALVGQVWSDQTKDQWPDIFQREVAAFTRYHQQSSRSQLITFLDLLYWLSVHSALDFQYFVRVFYQFIHYFEMEDLILALWKERGVQTKAAQRLYLHRNTLQNKLDRFLERTGLDLKNLDDLSLCYLAIQSQTL
ncbi:helix-turn-helix domain-containing protein [Streptococcus caprae]|uniref:Helix-turn-helix domain-containing protein n=1 Tax=Streptococcus caprae TaxID=1640501 RepID=A0ABV8CUB8_9STRE